MIFPEGATSPSLIFVPPTSTPMVHNGMSILVILVLEWRHCTLTGCGIQAESIINAKDANAVSSLTLGAVERPIGLVGQFFYPGPVFGISGDTQTYGDLDLGVVSLDGAGLDRVTDTLRGETRSGPVGV